MRNFCFFIILCILLPVCYFSSCAKVEKDDNEPPVVSDVRFNLNDTVIYYDAENYAVSVRINDSLKSRVEELDTLVVGKWLYVSARFTDDTGMSTFRVWGDLTYKGVTKVEAKVIEDSIWPIRRLGETIFGEKDIAVSRNRLIIIPDTITRTRNGVVDTLALDVSTKYNLYVECMDRAGNKNTDSLKPYEVRILHRQTIINR